MKILVVDKPDREATQGGSHTFQKMIREAMKNIESNNQYFYVKTGSANLKELVRINNIDFVWFTSPQYEEVDVPFAINVWDLGHRAKSYFPEVSVTGWTFVQREDFYRYVLPRAAIVFTGTSAGAKEINQFYQIPINRIVVVPMCIPQDFLPNDENFMLEKLNLEKSQYLLYPAQFWPHKNHITLIDALKILIDQGSNLKLVLTGSDKGNLSHVKKYIDELGLIDYVVMAGFVEESDLFSLYKNAFALTYASLLGPDNLPPLEAMLHTCPVICSDYSGAEDQLGGSALYFSGLDARDLAEKVAILYDEGVRNALIDAGRSLALTRNPTNYIENIDRIFVHFGLVRRLWSEGSQYKHL